MFLFLFFVFESLLILIKCAVEMNNLGAARKWAKEHTQPQKEQRRAARFANLKRGLIYP